MLGDAIASKKERLHKSLASQRMWEVPMSEKYLVQSSRLAQLMLIDFRTSNIHPLPEYPIPLFVLCPLSVTFFHVQWISGTKSRIINPLVAKRPGKKSEIKKTQKNEEKKKKNLKKFKKIKEN